MTSKIKHMLPTYSVLEHLTLEPELLLELQTCIRELESDFKSALEVNKKLGSVHHDLTSEIYKNFFQISLTDSILPNNHITMSELEMIGKELNKNGKIKGMRQKKLMSTDETSIHNEATFVHKTNIYHSHAEVFDKVLIKFKGTPTRIRLTKLEAGHSITPHIDYDPSYAVRIIIPIFTEPECVNMFWVKNNVECVAFKPSYAYFLNTGYRHAVINFSKNDRYAFMISIKGTEDIAHLIKY